LHGTHPGRPDGRQLGQRVATRIAATRPPGLHTTLTSSDLDETAIDRARPDWIATQAVLSFRPIVRGQLVGRTRCAMRNDEPTGTSMRTFVLRARAAPTDSQKLLAAVGQSAHSEILAHTLMNAIFVAQSHRADVTVYVVLESTADYSRTIRFDANAMHDIGGFDERALLGKIATALDASTGMGKDETRPVESGVTVRTVSFERLVQELADDHQLFVMDRKGTPMREQVFQDNPCFLLTDHIPMPKKTFHSLERLGAKKITLGRTMLFASQCVVLIHHELDQR
jgi:tRNA (pseudouridine54-N1)-methyltransferase